MQRCKRQWKLKEFIDLLDYNGFYFKRYAQGSHRIYTNGSEIISVPYVKQNPMLLNRLVKEYDLKLSL